VPARWFGVGFPPCWEEGFFSFEEQLALGEKSFEFPFCGDEFAPLLAQTQYPFSVETRMSPALAFFGGPLPPSAAVFPSFWKEEKPRTGPPGRWEFFVFFFVYPLFVGPLANRLCNWRKNARCPQLFGGVGGSNPDWKERGIPPSKSVRPLAPRRIFFSYNPIPQNNLCVFSTPESWTSSPPSLSPNGHWGENLNLKNFKIPPPPASGAPLF